MNTPRSRRPLFLLALLAIGGGVTLVWFQNKPFGKEKQNLSGCAGGTNTKPWKAQADSNQAPNTKEPTPAGLAAQDREGDLALERARYETRMDANAVASHLGLDRELTKKYVAARLEDLEPVPEHLKLPWTSSGFDGRLSADAWLNGHLTAEQKQAFEDYKESLVQEKAERAGFSIADGIAQSVKLTEQQRAAVAKKFAEIFQTDDPYKYPEYLKFVRGDDVDMAKADPALLAALTSDTTQSPLQTKDRGTWLDDILTPEQLATYRSSREK